MVVDLGDARILDGNGAGRIGAGCYRPPEVTLGETVTRQILRSKECGLTIT